MTDTSIFKKPYSTRTWRTVQQQQTLLLQTQNVANNSNNHHQNISFIEHQMEAYRNLSSVSDHTIQPHRSNNSNTNNSHREICTGMNSSSSSSRYCYPYSRQTGTSIKTNIHENGIGSSIRPTMTIQTNLLPGK